MIFAAEGALVLCFIRGDRRLNMAKLRALPGCAGAELATDDAMIRAAGIAAGYTGPLGLPPGVRVVADASLAGLSNLVVGGNREGYHYKNANWDRDMPRPVFADLTLAEAGDPCPACGAALAASRGIEVGQIFRLSAKYSEAMKVAFLDDDGVEKPLVMGGYAIGITCALATVIEQHHDENGIIWPIALAPFHVVITCLGDKGLVRETAERLYADLLKEGIEVLYDDRDLGPGFKLKDADLIGIPLRVVVGERGLKEGALEFKLRSRPEREKIPLDQAIPAIRERLDELWRNHS